MINSNNIWLRNLLFAASLSLILPSVVLSRHDRLLLTERTFWRPIDSYIKVEKINNRSIRSERVLNSSKITLFSSHSVVIRSRNGDLLRFRVETGSIDNIEIFRLSGYGQSLVKTLPKEIEISGKSLLISPPTWIPDPLYQFQIRSNKPEDSLTLIGEYLDRESYRFYFDDVEQEARRDISKGLWQSRTAELWRRLEPGDRVREFYRRQLAVIPWLQDKSLPDYEIAYRKARLALDLLEFRRPTLDYESLSIRSLTPVKGELNIDEKSYQLESSFYFNIQGPALIEIATRLPYSQTPLHEVKTYSIDLQLNGRFFDRLFFDTRLDDLCALVIDQSNRPLGRLRTQSILIPPGLHKLQLEASEQIYLSVMVSQRRRAYLRDVFHSNQEIETFLRRAVEEAELRLLNSPGDHRATYIRAAALIDLGQSKDAIEPLRQLLKELPDSLLRASVEILLARSISGTKAFEDAIKVFTPDLNFSSLTNDLLSVHRRAIGIERALEESRLLRLSGKHLLAAETLGRAISLDPYGTILYEKKAEALKWVPDLHSINPEFIDLYDRALALSPSDNRLLIGRGRAWNDFTYWQTIRPERTNGENGLAGFDYQPDRTDGVEDFRDDLISIGCDAQSRLIDYSRRSLYFYRLPLGVPFRLDLRNPFESKDELDNIQFRISHSCQSLFELNFIVNGTRMVDSIIYRSGQIVELKLPRAIHDLKIELKPSDTHIETSCIQLYLNRPPLNDIANRGTDLPFWDRYIRRNYLPISSGTDGRLDFLTRDDSSPTIGRVLFRPSKNEFDSQIRANILIDDQIVEKVLIDSSLGKVLSSLQASPVPYEFLFLIPAGRHRVSIQLEDLPVERIWVNFALRTRRQENLEEVE